MARHRAHYRKRGKVWQDSPFLDLPGEIRTMIYYAALWRPTSIDLWPADYIEEPEKDTALTVRIAKVKAKAAPSTDRYRNQKDLLYVRKEMATGLLATCSQVFNEAQHIFWRENTFRFSGDREWFGARRFLGSIGPRALSQLRSLELFAPIGYGMAQGANATGLIYDRQAKNHPKMHMVKARKDLNDIFWIDTGGMKGNVDHVLTLLEGVRDSIELKLLLPISWELETVGVQWNDVTMTYDHDVLFTDKMEEAIPKFAKRITFIAEAAAVVKDPLVPDRIVAKGMDFVCNAGSFMVSVS